MHTSKTNKKTIRFQKSDPFTLGVEVELQVLSASSLNLTPLGPEILRKTPPELRPFVKPEAYQSMIEIITPVCKTLSEVEKFLREGLQTLEKIAQNEGALLLPLSLHPFSRAKEQKIWGKKRYLKIFEELQLVGRRFIAQGLHVHLGMPDKETALKVYNLLRPYLPLLLALSTSSPFYEGEKTGFHSYRSKLFEVLPLAGLPRSFGSWAEYEALVDILLRLKIISSLRDLWWDIRLKPELGTVEIRICDVPGRFRDLLALVAFIQALACFVSEKKPPPGLPHEIISFGKWQAARHGLNGSFVEPEGLKRKNFRAATEELLEKLQGPARKLGSEGALKSLPLLLEERPASFRMLALFEKGATFREIIESLREDFWS